MQSHLIRITGSVALASSIPVNSMIARIKSVMIFVVSTGAQVEDFTIKLSDSTNFNPTIHTTAMANQVYARADLGGILVREGQSIDLAWANARASEWFVELEIEQ